MKILFDHQIFTMQKYGGISRYFYELIKRFEFTDTSAELALKYSNNVGDMVKPFFPDRTFRGKQRLHDFINETNSSKKIRKSNYDVFHPTYYDPYFLKNLGSKPFVVTFLDMIHEKFSDKYTELALDKTGYDRKQILAEKASKIIAISESTKNDMVEILNVDPAKIEVIYLGSSFNTNNAGEAPIYAFPYLLYVGNRTMYKNFTFFLQSIASILSTENIRLVCAGGGKFTNEDLALIEELGLNEIVIYTDFNDKILANLYKYATAFVFPSLYEGFGIPVLEAFACNCPCILSNTSSLPEVGGEAALYFDPQNGDSINETVSRVLHSESLRLELISKGSERLKLFSWDKMFAETDLLYKSII
jgi:glycosyltransferase involved in cell wall biosynthesis